MDNRVFILGDPNSRIEKKHLDDFGFVEDKNLPHLSHLYNDANHPIMSMDNNGTTYTCTFKIGRNIGKVEVENLRQFLHLCLALGIKLKPHCYD